MASLSSRGGIHPFASGAAESLRPTASPTVPRAPRDPRPTAASYALAMDTLSDQRSWEGAMPAPPTARSRSHSKPAVLHIVASTIQIDEQLRPDRHQWAFIAVEILQSL